jgi:hypothetical protein
MGYIQPGTEAPKKEVPSAHAYVTPSQPSGNHVQSDTQARAVEVQAGRLHVSATATGVNYQQPNIVSNIHEVQQAKPFGAIASPPPSNYVQPDHRPKEVHHDRLSVPNPVIGYYQQPGTGSGPNEQIVDLGLTTLICPLDGTTATHVGSQQYAYRCQQGHAIGYDATGALTVAFFGGLTPNKFLEPVPAFLL